ncbi:MAG: 3-deoxy-D-manno-octulosonic acid transferase [Gemmatimonadales bacterium]
MPRTSLLYRIGLGMSLPLVPVAGLFDAKIRRSHPARRRALREFQQWGATSRDPARPLIWFHAPSVGEGLQARPVLARLRARHPDWQFAYTFFSPSAEGFARKSGADVSGYIPYDTARMAKLLLDALRPSALVFAKLDLWPELATRAAARGIPPGLIAGTVRPRSSRLRWPARQLLRPGYAALSLAGAISDADRARLSELGCRPETLRVLGDPRFDSVIDVVRAAPEDDPLKAFGHGAPTMVAGSTWPGDEAVLLEAFARLHVRRPTARLILVPHEPTPAHLAQIDRLAARFGLSAPVRSSAAGGPVPLLVVDQIGILARLYGAGTMAFVGGGFHGRGLHSVLEPAAWGIPSVFGPRWEESRDASLLLEAGGAEALAELGAVEAAGVLENLWEDWIVNEIRRKAQGRKAYGVVQQGLGAADRTADAVETLVIG